MNCKNCNAVMRMDVERKAFICPYCESIEPFDGVSKSELQGMLHAAIADVRKESINEAKQAIRNEKAFGDNRSANQKALDALILIFQIGFCVLLAIFSIAIFTEYASTGFVSLLQLALMITAMILKPKARREKNAKLLKIKNLCLIGVAVLVIVWIATLMHESGATSGGDREGSWPKQGIGSEIEAPEGKIKYSYSSKSGFNATIADSDGTGYDAFVEACKEAGYVIDPEFDDDQYHAYNEADDEIMVSYWNHSKEFNVQIDKGIVWGEFQWPTGELMEGIPVPEAEKSSLVKLSNKTIQIYVGEVTKQQFIQYVLDCQKAGFDGTYYDDKNDYYGHKDKVTIRMEFKRGKIMFIDIYEYN